jgi:hypothetical protein
MPHTSVGVLSGKRSEVRSVVCQDGTTRLGREGKLIGICGGKPAGFLGGQDIVPTVGKDSC